MTFNILCVIVYTFTNLRGNCLKISLYRIYFGCKIPNSPWQVSKTQLLLLLNSYPEIKGYTLFEAEGYWLGVNEPTFVLEIGLPSPVFGMTIAYDYLLTFNQQSVMIVMPDNECIFI